MRRLINLFIFSYFLISCESGVEFDNIEAQELVAVSCFISPQDSLLTATVYKGQSLDKILRQDSLIIKDAEVVISHEQSRVILKYNERTKFYENSAKQLKIEQGKTYTLTVKTKQNKVITGQCTIPNRIKEGKIISKKNNDELEYFSVWEKASGSNYYLTNTLVKGTYISNNRVVSLTPNIGFSNESSLIETKEGETIKISGGVSNWYKSTNALLTITMLVLDNNTFKYLKTLEKYNNFNANLSNTLPSFTEPQPLYSNMKGDGIGIFGGYQQTSITFK